MTNKQVLEPQVAYKTSQVVVLEDSDNPRVVYKSPTFDVLFGNTIDSMCFTDPTHDFDIDCKCGFYAYRTPLKARDYDGYRKGNPVFEVKISGELCEYEKGYRGSRQRVLRLIYDTCVNTECDNPAVLLLYSNGFIGVCQDCVIEKSKTGFVVSFEELERLLPPAAAGFKPTTVENGAHRGLTTIEVEELRSTLEFSPEQQSIWETVSW